MPPAAFSSEATPVQLFYFFFFFFIQPVWPCPDQRTRSPDCSAANGYRASACGAASGRFDTASLFQESHFHLAGASAQQLQLGDPNYVLVFLGVYPGSGKLTGQRFTTALTASARIFQISNVTLDACAAACDIDQTCLGFYFRVASDGVNTVCTALNNIGSASGSVTTANAYSYAKQVRPNDRSNSRPSHPILCSRTRPWLLVPAPLTPPASTRTLWSSC